MSTTSGPLWTPADDGGYAKLDQLFGATATEERDHVLPSGLRVRVRGMTRAELLINARLADGNTLVIEQHNVASAMVRPVMTPADVERWQRKARAGDFTALVDVVRELSGLVDGQPKSDVSGDGDDRA